MIDKGGKTELGGQQVVVVVPSRVDCGCGETAVGGDVTVLSLGHHTRAGAEMDRTHQFGAHEGGTSDDAPDFDQLVEQVGRELARGDAVTTKFAGEGDMERLVFVDELQVWKIEGAGSGTNPKKATLDEYATERHPKDILKIH